MVAPRLSWLVALVCCSATSAYDLTKVREPKGQLAVTLDLSVALSFPHDAPPVKDKKSPRNWVWTSHMKFRQPVAAITNGQLWKITRDAYDEMNVDAQQYAIKLSSRPKALATLAWGNELIISSTQKGLGSFTYEYNVNSPVLKDLQLCQQVWKDATNEDKEHRTRGKCAEPMACHVYYTLNPDAHLEKQQARIASVVENSQGVVEQQDPCVDPDQQTRDIWGCNVFTESQDLTVISKDIQPEDYDLSSIAGGRDSYNQIELCGTVRATRIGGRPSDPSNPGGPSGS